MTTPLEAMRLAVEALDDYKYAEARIALRAALEQIEKVDPVPVKTYPLEAFFALDEQLEAMEAKLTAPAVPYDVEKWQLVPKEPTCEMWNAGQNHSQHDGEDGTTYLMAGKQIEQIYKAMLQAAPKPEDV